DAAEKRPQQHVRAAEIQRVHRSPEDRGPETQKTPLRSARYAAAERLAVSLSCGGGPVITMTSEKPADSNCSRTALVALAEALPATNSACDVTRTSGASEMSDCAPAS